MCISMYKAIDWYVVGSHAMQGSLCHRECWRRGNYYSTYIGLVFDEGLRAKMSWALSFVTSSFQNSINQYGHSTKGLRGWGVRSGSGSTRVAWVPYGCFLAIVQLVLWSYVLAKRPTYSGSLCSRFG